jgi:hypothetical protein
VSSPSDPQQPPPGGQSSTQEIPLVQPAGATAAPRQLPPHPDTTPQGTAPVDAAQPTGPVDFVPGLPGTPPVAQSATPAPPPPVPPRQVADAPDAVAPATAPGPVWPETLDAHSAGRPGKKPRIRAARDRGALIGIVLVVLSVALLELGLTMDFGEESYWSAVPLWSAFATVCAVLGFAAFAAWVPGAARLASGPGWRIAAGGLVGLALFWLLVVLPVVASDRGFVLTMSVAALGGALWIGARLKA